MAGVVHHGLVQQDQVLVRPATAHIETTVAFAIAFHTGQVLYGLQDVHFAQQGGQCVQLLHIDADASHVRALSVARSLLGGHFRLLGHEHLGPQVQVQFLIVLQFNRPHEFLVAQVPHHDRVGARFQGQ